MRNESWVIAAFLKASIKIFRDVIFALKMFDRIPWPSFDCRLCHYSPHIETIEHAVSDFDIGILGRFITATQQDHKNFTTLHVIHAVARTMVDPHFDDRGASRFPIPRITHRQAINARLNSTLGESIT